MDFQGAALHPCCQHFFFLTRRHLLKTKREPWTELIASVYLDKAELTVLKCLVSSVIISLVLLFLHKLKSKVHVSLTKTQGVRA